MRANILYSQPADFVINENGEPVFSGIGGNSQKEYERIVKEKINKILSSSKHEITNSEWNDYEWIESSEFPAGFIRGIKRTYPPDDGYKYIEVTTLADKEQKWSRAFEVLP